MARATISLPVPLSPVISTGGIAGGHCADGLAHRQDGGAGADDLVQIYPVVLRLGDGGDLPRQAVAA
jgi:hypothetical protein